MKLWKIYTHHFGYDDWDAFVICARSTQRVRSIAVSEAYDNKNAFKSITKSKIKYLGKTNIKKEGIILGSYNAG